MKAATPLPGAVGGWLRRIVPAAAAPAVLADLSEEYDAVRGTRHAVAAWWWLARETASLSWAYALSRAPRWRSWPTLLTRDARLVLRGIRRRPLAAAGASGMLSIGLLALMISAGLASTLLLRPLSAAHGERLRRVGALDQQGRLAFRLSFPELALVREHLSPAATVTSVNLQPAVVRTGTITLQTMVEAVDGDYFAVMGLQTRAGRGILGTDDRPGAAPVVVIAEPFWRTHFAGAPDIAGRVLRINGAAYTVIGVLTGLGSSSFLGASVDAWIPVAHADALLNRGWRTDPTSRWFTAFALPHRDAAELEARVAGATTELRRVYPEPWRDRRLYTADGTLLVGSQRAGVMLLVGILGVLALLIVSVAAANASGVLLARVSSEGRHVAIHLAVGSGRAAIVRRLLLEGALLGVGGAALAAVMYAWSRAWLAEISLLPTLALRLDLPLDAWIVCAFCLTGACAGLLLAVGPALWALRLDLARWLRDADGRVSGGRAVARARRALIAAQVCVSMALIVGAALFAQSLNALNTADLGFPRERLVALDFDLEPASVPEEELPRLAREALARVAALPSVAGAAMSNRAPVDQSTPVLEVRAAPQGPAVEATMYLATTGYFDTVGLPVVAGRAFREEDARMSEAVIVNETLARRLWPDGDPVGRSLYDAAESRRLVVVGVAANSKYRSLSEPPRAHLYRPTAPTLNLTLLARTSQDPHATLGAIQRALDDVEPGLVGFFPRTLSDHLAIDLLPTRAAAGAATLLAALALAMSGVGLYGIVSWFVELRRREIAVRMAMGAGAGAVRALVVRQALLAAAPGLAAGVVVALALALTARSALYGVGPLDPLAFAAGVVSLAMVVMLASYVPGRRATRVDPAAALRQ